MALQFITGGVLSIEHWQRCRKWNAIAQRIRIVPWQYVTLGSPFADGLLSRYWVRVSRRVLPASVILPQQRCADSTCNIRVPSCRPTRSDGFYAVTFTPVAGQPSSV